MGEREEHETHEGQGGACAGVAFGSACNATHSLEPARWQAELHQLRRLPQPRCRGIAVRPHGERQLPLVRRPAELRARVTSSRCRSGDPVRPCRGSRAYCTLAITRLVFLGSSGADLGIRQRTSPLKLDVGAARYRALLAQRRERPGG